MLVRQRQWVMVEQKNRLRLGRRRAERGLDRADVVFGDEAVPVEPAPVVRAGRIEPHDQQPRAPRHLHALAGHQRLTHVIAEAIVIARHRDRAIEHRFEDVAKPAQLGAQSAVRHVSGEQHRSRLLQQRFAELLRGAIGSGILPDVKIGEVREGRHASRSCRTQMAIR